MEQSQPAAERRANNKEAKMKLDELREQEKHLRQERKTKEAQRDFLERLYADEFDIDNPPECYERFEADSALAYLRGSVHRRHRKSDSGEAEFGDEEIQAAKKTIDVMATYGQLAEKDIAALTRMDLPPEVYTHAIETLSEVRQEQEEPPSLRESLARWLSP